MHPNSLVVHMLASLVKAVDDVDGISEADLCMAMQLITGGRWTDAIHIEAISHLIVVDVLVMDPNTGFLRVTAKAKELIEADKADKGRVPRPNMPQAKG